MRNETQTKRNGKLEYKFFPGIEAYKFVQRLTEESENIVVLLEPNLKMDSRWLARVLFDNKDYCTLSLKYGLSFPYPTFCNDKKYIKLAADARKKKIGVFRIDRTALDLIIPWDVRSEMINKKDLICDFKINKAYCYLELRKSCAKCSLKVPYCCIDQSRASFKKNNF